jgi:serine/threonine protein kinase
VMRPEKIGKYSIIEKIGQGLTSEVFKAHDPLLNRFVALKTISQRVDGKEEVRKRFYREAQSAAQLNHPNIITVFELGHEQNKIFIAMELLEGSDLKEIIRSKKPLTLDQKLDMVEQICEGLGYAHSKGIVHRDLAPGNIHVQPNGHLKLMDFGLARLASSDITRTGMVMGTPNYMAPEQIQAERADTPADVFSVGAITFELLSYRKPFIAESIHATLMRVLRGDRESLERWVPDLPPPLVAMVHKALAHDPNHRFRHGSELLEAVRAVRKELAIGSQVGVRPMWSKVPHLPQRGDRPEEPSADGVKIATRQSLTGSLTTMHLADLLQWCVIKGKTGTLRLRRGPIEKKLYFKIGRLFSSTTNSPRETLGQFLIRSGYITEAQLFKALLEQERVEEPLGRILIGQGLLDESKLQELLQLKCKESIYDCFLWTDGDFCFEDDELPQSVPATFSLDITQVIQEGISRMERWESIRGEFPSRLTTFEVNRAAVDGLGRVGVSEEEHRILELVERGKNLAEIALELHAVDFYAASRLLDLHQSGLVKVAHIPQELPYEKQVEELRNRLADGLKFFKQGQHSEALAAFEAAIAIDPQSKAHVFVQKISQMAEEARPELEIPFDHVPVLKVPVSELEKRNLAPQEGFVISRMSGEWDVRSILMICPMSEEEVLKILKRFLSDGIIELHAAEKASEQ